MHQNAGFNRAPIAIAASSSMRLTIFLDSMLDVAELMRISLEIQSAAFSSMRLTIFLGSMHHVAELMRAPLETQSADPWF